MLKHLRIGCYAFTSGYSRPGRPESCTEPLDLIKSSTPRSKEDVAENVDENGGVDMDVRSGSVGTTLSFRLGLGVKGLSTRLGSKTSPRSEQIMVSMLWKIYGR